MLPGGDQPEIRRKVASKHGYPWPWEIQELVEEHAVEADVDLRDLAERWGVGYRKLTRWIRRHGFQTEDYQAKR